MSSKKSLVFVKLGGAAITFKEFPKKANEPILDSCARQISDLKHECQFLIGHGGGGFAHPIAAKYKVNEGIAVAGLAGVTETHRAVRELNSIVVNYLMDRGVPAFSVFASSAAVASDGKIKQFYTNPIKELLANDLVPVISGDVVPDTKKGCSIASTEMIFSFLLKKFKPKRIVVGTDVDGVFVTENGQEKVVPEINRRNYKEVLETIGSSKYTDVTGGMKHKVMELYNISKKVSDVQIINLLKEGNLAKAIKGEHVGTLIVN
ncbi:TPA: isopentenyl phosphate kinase family protein [archaeon]|nr:isopentenyl phosphate kinase family protein [Candidatus Naiadarchaeales archaeon SRR2090159.bin1288]